MTFVTWRHAEGAARAGAARKAITVSRSLSAQTSRDVFREHAGDAACWGSVGGKRFGTPVYIAAPPPLGRGDDAEAPLRSRWKMEVINHGRLTFPRTTPHPQAMERDAARGDRDRQLTKNNMCLTQPRTGGKKKKKRGSREGTVDDAVEPLRICEPGR